LQLVVELAGHSLAANGKHFQGVFMHAQLGISYLHASHELLHLIRQAVEVVALALEGEHGGLVVGLLGDVVHERQKICSSQDTGGRPTGRLKKNISSGPT
jgi:hypothetical protein